MASTAAATTARSAGRHPAMTALMATFSAVIASPRTGSTPRMRSGSSSAASRAAATSSGVGGTIGNPSVQPLRPNTALTSTASATSRIRAPIGRSLRGRRPSGLLLAPLLGDAVVLLAHLAGEALGLDLGTQGGGRAGGRPAVAVLHLDVAGPVRLDHGLEALAPGPGGDGVGLLHRRVVAGDGLVGAGGLGLGRRRQGQDEPGGDSGGGNQLGRGHDRS